MKYSINNKDALDDFITGLNDGGIKIVKQIGDTIYANVDGERCELDVQNQVVPAAVNNVIYGKDSTKNIVNISSKNDKIYTYIRNGEDIIEQVTDAKQFALAPIRFNNTFNKLNGIGHYSYMKTYTPSSFKQIKSNLYKGDFYFIDNVIESHMILNGMTYFKGMKNDDVSLLSFDLETATLDPNRSNASIFCIGSTYRYKNTILKRVFRQDHFPSIKDMIEGWCEWVRELNPDVLTGYNIYLFDIPYLIEMAKRHGAVLSLGRDGSTLDLEQRKKPRTIRKDGSQEYDYKRPECFGREIIDMWIVTLKADQAAKKYDSYALKHVIKVEGLEKEGRTHYDASKINEDWKDINKRNEICQYCEDDTEDPIKLWDLMITPFFLITSHLPKPFQIVTETNTGGQINSLLVRSYLQEGWSIPKKQETGEFQGAISLGVPGLYKNAIKWDVSSLYPSIMRTYEIRPQSDYLGCFLKMLEYFTLQRIENKKLAKSTGDKYYDDLQGMQKIFINSAYGFLTTPGLNFNDMRSGALVTKTGREVLEKSIMWATGHNAEYWMKLNDKTEEEEQCT